jgi:hypothetical protein
LKHANALVSAAQENNMPENDTSDATPPEDQPEDAVELDIDSKADAIEFVKHHVNVASNVEVTKSDSGEGFSGTASGFVGGSAFVPSTALTGPSKAQAKAAAEAKINAGATKVTLAKQADGTWTVA